ncbi:MAG: hypothetical protein JXR07_12065 [Reichenbachiella sp.]
MDRKNLTFLTAILMLLVGCNNDEPGIEEGVPLEELVFFENFDRLVVPESLEPSENEFATEAYVHLSRTIVEISEFKNNFQIPLNATELDSLVVSVDSLQLSDFEYTSYHNQEILDGIEFNYFYQVGRLYSTEFYWSSSTAFFGGEPSIFYSAWQNSDESAGRINHKNWLTPDVNFSWEMTDQKLTISAADVSSDYYYSSYSYSIDLNYLENSGVLYISYLQLGIDYDMEIEWDSQGNWNGRKIDQQGNVIETLEW